MHPLLRQVAYGTLIPALHAATRARVAIDRRGADPAARRLLDVLARTLRDDFTAAERAWFDRVEELRAQQSASDERVQLVDYGAGSPDSTRSADEMRRGVPFEATVGEICRRASKAPFWARLLFALVREYRPRHGIELGTCLAVSASYQAAALALGQQPAALVTLEGAPELAVRAQRNLERVGLAHVARVLAGRFDQTLPTLLASGPAVDYAFIDGHHDEQATLDYFAALKPRLAPGAVLVFDDIAWSPGMRRAWQAICADPAFAVTLDLRAVGIGVLGDGGPRHYRYYLR